MQWFVEEVNFKGNWIPAVYFSSEPPSVNSLNGRRKFRKDPVPIKSEHFHLEFSDKVKLYGSAK